MEHKVAVVTLLLVMIQLYCISADTAAGQGRCRSVQTCRRQCPYGYITDAQNCRTCLCRSQPRPIPNKCGPVCLIFCKYGNVLDKRGCPTCRCKPGPGLTPSRPYQA